MAIDPAAQGRGLGKALTLAGLRHLPAAARARCCSTSSRTTPPRSRVYDGLGFTHAAADTHAMYHRR